MLGTFQVYFVLFKWFIFSWKPDFKEIVLFAIHDDLEHQEFISSREITDNSVDLGW